MPTFSTIGLGLVKIRSVLTIILLFGLILHSNPVVSQPSVIISKGKEAGIFGGLAVHSFINLKLEEKISVNEIHYWKIRRIDRLAPLRFSSACAHTSDITFAATGLLALYSVSQRQTAERNTAGLLMTQNLWMTWNITQTTKMLARRARPYASESGFSVGKKDDAYSFFSGHTSLTACMAASHYFYDRSLAIKDRRPGITLGLTALSIGTGILRIKAGKHFPTDVLAGAILGTGVAYLNTKLHGR